MLAFLAVWLLCETVLHIDRETAQALASLAATLVLVPLTWWAPRNPAPSDGLDWIDVHAGERRAAEAGRRVSGEVSLALVHRRAPGGDLLLERDRQLRQAAGMLDAVTAGRGGILMVKGPAGIGKTRFVSELRAMSRACGLVTLYACGSERESDVPFSVARQLFGPYRQNLPISL
jgi:hypothetical protein